MSGADTNMLDLLKRFALSENVEEQAAAISKLMYPNRLHKAAENPLFDQGMQSALKAAATASAPEQRLSSVAMLLKVAGFVRAWRPRIAEMLSSILDKPLPPLQAANDNKDREYIAKLYRYNEPPWLRSYLASGAVEEESAEDAREECIAGLLALSPDLAGVLESLSTPLRRLDFQTEKPGDSKGKRVRRLLEPLKTAYLASSKDPGPSAGELLRRLLMEAFQQTGVPTTESVLDEVAEESLGLVHAIVRARFSTATLPETYAAMDVVRGWYREPRWEEFAEASPSAQLLARDISEATELLVRAGKTDDVLYGRLVTAAGNQERARYMAKQILERTPGLQDELARWLSGTTIKRKSAFATQNQLLGVDEALADLMIDWARLEQMHDQIQRDALPELSVMTPRAAVSVERLLGLVKSITNTIQALTRVRGLAIVGKSGAAVDFSPLEHEMAGGAKPGVTKARIVKPGVDTPNEAGGRRVVRKAIVEPLD